MKTCKDCLHYEVCASNEYVFSQFTGEIFERLIYIGNRIDCKRFKDKSRYIELPCKVGDKLFILYDDDYGEYECSEFCVGALEELRVFAKCGISGYQNIQDCPEYYCGQPFCSTSFIRQDFGKTVFLTREEAEKVLTERMLPNKEL